MKRTLIFLLFLFFFFIFPKDIHAYQQTEAICYSQCLAYRFVWQGTYCYDVFADNCTEEKGNTIIKTIKFLKTIYDTVESGENIDIPFTAMFVCKPLIDSCIVPNQEACHQICQTNPLAYAPDLSVGHPDSSFNGVFYSEKEKQLYFKLVNNGMGYAWDIDVEATSGHTPNRDGIIQNNQQIFKEKVEHLIFFGARNGPPKSFSDTVQDFLVEESLNGQYLHNFKSWVVDSLDLHSDSKDYNVPSYWIKGVPFEPKAGELNRITFKVDSNNLIPEAWEQNNTFVLDIDLRPTPARYSIETFSQHIVANTLNSFLINFQVKNTGEEGGLAKIKIFEGKFQEGKTPVYQSDENIAGISGKNIETTINIDLSSEPNPYCGNLKGYTIQVTDEEGNKTERSFSLPIYLGSVNGRIYDLFGKPIKNVTIKSTTGQEVQSSDKGYYHLKGITTLGKITLTASHPEYSKPDTKEIELKYGNEFDACKEGNLLFNSVNFILKDQEVVFTVTLKDASGNLINGHVLATNKVSDNAEISKNNFRLDKDINGTGELGALQPGEYMFTISAGGYKTMAQTVSAVPNNQNLEFILEPILGRSNDGTMVIQAPQLLWQMDRGEEILSQITATKDGKLVVLYTTRNKANTGKLYFLNSLTGSQIKVISSAPATKGQSQACLETSYDGNTTAFMVHNDGFGMAQDTKNVLILLNSQGKEFARTEYSSGGGASDCSVSPDGFYIFPGFLINKSLYTYSRMEIEGIGGYSHMGYSSIGPLYFLHGNGLIAACKEHGDGDQCAQYVNHTEITRFSRLEGSIRVVDSSFNDQRVIFGGYDKLLVYSAGTKVFEKEVNASGSQEPSSSISMGGQYIIYSYNEPKVHNAIFKIVNSDNVDKTPSYNKDVNENVLFVHANDKGLFYLAEKNKTLKYYQVGKYTTEYNPQTQATPPPPLKTTGLSMHINGNFSPAGEKSYSELDPGFMYRADRSLTLNIFGNGSSLHILEGTIFSLDGGKNLVLLKGQITADFDAPVTIYAIKFDRFDLALFQTKLNQFWRIRTLPENEYFIIKNIHTKFTVKNDLNNFNVSVEKGQVSVLADKTEKIINSGKQITIDASNKIKESVYVGSKIYTIVIGIIIIILSIVLFIYRKTKTGSKIIEILKKIGKLIWKIVRKVTPVLWKWTKRLFQFLVNFFKKIFEKKK